MSGVNAGRSIFRMISNSYGPKHRSVEGRATDAGVARESGRKRERRVSRRGSLRKLETARGLFRSVFGDFSNGFSRPPNSVYQESSRMIAVRVESIEISHHERYPEPSPPFV